MAEKLKIFLFALIFIITLGIVAIGVLLSYNMHRSYRKQFMQTLLYQQIFIYSFLLYGAWGRIFLEKAIAGFNISQQIIDKISFFMPVLGLPFIIIAWFMLIKFFFEVKGIKISKMATVGYFIFFGLLITGGVWYVNTGSFREMEDPENIFLILLSTLNLFANLIIIIPLFLLKPSKQDLGIKFMPANILFYLLGVLTYSIGIWFMKEHFLVTAVTILAVFVFYASVPVFTTIKLSKIPETPDINEMNFENFCRKFEISKREAEIIKEICLGKSNQAIADKLFITLQTVKDHTHRIYTKAGVKNRVHLTNLVREKIIK